MKTHLVTVLEDVQRLDWHMFTLYFLYTQHSHEQAICIALPEQHTPRSATSLIKRTTSHLTVMAAKVNNDDLKNEWKNLFAAVSALLVLWQPTAL